MSEWTNLVKKTVKENPGMDFGKVLKLVKKKYNEG
jgi:hypothetical protein